MQRWRLSLKLANQNPINKLCQSNTNYHHHGDNWQQLVIPTGGTHTAVHTLALDTHMPSKHTHTYPVVPVHSQSTLICMVKCTLTDLFTHDPLSSSGYPIFTYTNPIAGNLHTKTLQIHTTHILTHTHTHTCMHACTYTHTYLLIGYHLYLVSSLIDTFLGANNLDDVRGVIMARNGDLCSCGQLNVLEFLALLANHKPVVFLGNLQIIMGLKVREREREREREMCVWDVAFLWVCFVVWKLQCKNH